MTISTREMTPSDAEKIVDYFSDTSEEYLSGMGADKSRLPARKDWIEAIQKELEKPFEEKQLYYVIWEVDGRAIGHCNINNISYGKEAFMHLHIWKTSDRQFGNGLELVRKSIPEFFDNFKLQRLRCEPYALNPAPTKVLERAGFVFKEIYETTPSAICSPQSVKRYEMSLSQFLMLDL